MILLVIGAVVVLALLILWVRYWWKIGVEEAMDEHRSKLMDEYPELRDIFDFPFSDFPFTTHEQRLHEQRLAEERRFAGMTRRERRARARELDRKARADEEAPE